MVHIDIILVLDIQLTNSNLQKEMKIYKHLPI